MTKHVVAAVEALPPGSRTLVDVDGRPIVIFNVKGEYFALRNRCPHQGGNLSKGTLTGLITAPEPGRYEYSREGEILRCPWHGWEFDIRTGKSCIDPMRIRVKSYTVEVESGRHVVEGPYVAETVPVAVEADYVVVDV
jgi:nitrite reductase/ring-hydroxylating ferredoxin subunit